MKLSDLFEIVDGGVDPAKYGWVDVRKNLVYKLELRDFPYIGFFVITDVPALTESQEKRLWEVTFPEPIINSVTMYEFISNHHELIKPRGNIDGMLRVYYQELFYVTWKQFKSRCEQWSLAYKNHHTGADDFSEDV